MAYDGENEGQDRTLMIPNLEIRDGEKVKSAYLERMNDTKSRDKRRREG